MANFVVPHASTRWYFLALQLLDPQDEGKVHGMKMETSKPPEEQCTEMFSHWLKVKNNAATWKQLINGLKSQSVNLPNVARDVEKMLGINILVSYCCR